jgi:trehalose 6-phosphate synthase
MPHPPRSSLVTVANRLPVAGERVEDGWTWRIAPGGLVSAVAPVMRERGGTWVGWAGVGPDVEVPTEAEGIALTPVPLDEDDIELFYEGFANATVWPLYHDVTAQPEFHRATWQAYQRVNQRYAEVAAEAAGPDAVVWVHDYHLQLVPRLLRDLRPDVRIGYFNHIPFPPYELFAQLPWRRQIVEGLLGADHLGFQRVQDANNFLRACRRAIRLPTREGAALVPDRGSTRRVTARAHPISIASHEWDALSASAEVADQVAAFREQLGGRRLLLGADRLDYTKGIEHRLTAIGELYDDGALDPDEVMVVQVASPTRERVEAYLRLRESTESLVGRINGEHSRLGAPAVHYLRTSFNRAEMLALYRLADVMLVTPLRDGMNLVAKEFVAARSDLRGVLVLSEFTGAADSLTRAVLVNPHDIAGIKEAIVRGLQMSPREQATRMRAMRREVLRHDVAAWADGFLGALDGGTGRSS